METIAPSFFIRTSPNLKILMKTEIKSRATSISGQMGLFLLRNYMYSPLSVEIISHTYNEENVGTIALLFFSLVPGLIGLFPSALLTLERQNIFPYKFYWRKYCRHESAFIFDQITIKLAGNQDRHKISRTSTNSNHTRLLKEKDRK